MAFVYMTVYLTQIAADQKEELTGILSAIPVFGLNSLY